MVDSQAGRVAKAKQPRGLDAGAAVQNLVVLTDQYGHAEAKRHNRPRHFIDMSACLQGKNREFASNLVIMKSPSETNFARLRPPPGSRRQRRWVPSSESPSKF